MTAGQVAAATAPAAGPQPHGTDARRRNGPGPDGQPGPCTCPPCLDASAKAKRDRRRAIAYGRWNPFTDAAPARQHIAALSAQGIGSKTAALLAGVSPETIKRLASSKGSGQRPQTRRIRRETEAKILAVRPGLDVLPRKQPVDAAGTRRRLQALMAAGHPRVALAARLGRTPPNVNRMMREKLVHASTARAVRALYEDLWDTAPDVSTPHAARMSDRTRKAAAGRGWPKPMAWDDDLIDDPAAPAPASWEFRQHARHRDSAALAEDAEFLMKHYGYDRKGAAGHLGVSRHALDKAFARTAAAEAAAAAQAARADSEDIADVA